MTARAPGPPAVRAFGATHVGRRRTANEDRFHVDVARGIFIVVDGVGGHAAGDQAADTAIAAMVERLERQTGTARDRVREAITIANNAIYRLASSNPAWRGMACVTTAVVLDGDRAVVGHVGDSRLYRFAGGAIEKITPDHSPVGEREDAKEMSEVEAMRHPRRNEVYRDVGSEPREVSDTDFVFVSEIPLAPGSALLLCSDGLTDLVASDSIRQITASHTGSPEMIVQALIAAANDAGGKDNVTAIYVERPGSRSSTAANRLLRASLVVAVAVLAALVFGAVAVARGWKVPGVALPILAPAPGAVSVRAGESIAAALAKALPGSLVVVEPGEYRERITLREGVRVLSRVPRAATLRLPADAAESDSAVVADAIGNAELTGFRIVGDAASALGVGVTTRNAAVRLSDLEVTGAVTAALDLGSGEVSVSGSLVHDNPGSALVIRAGASPRVAHSVIAVERWADPMVAPVIVEVGASPMWSQNVFNGLAVDGIAGVDGDARALLSRTNWFFAAPVVTTPAVRRGPVR